MINLSVIIVNYNTASEVIACIHSLLKQQALNFDIWVIDNASADGSAARLTAEFGTRIHLIQNTTNDGFGKANNIAASQARGEYLYFLNPDTVLPDTHGLATLYQYAVNHPESGLVGSKVVDSKTKHVIKAATHYPHQRHLKHTAGLNTLPGAIAWIQGSSMLMKKSLFNQLNGFDPDYFLYAEETDLCLRVRKAGHEIHVCLDVTVEHIGGASQRHEKIAAMRLKKQQGLYLFYQKHYHPTDCRHLAQRALTHSCWKIRYLRCLQYFKRVPSTALIRQRVIHQAAQSFLQQH